MSTNDLPNMISSDGVDLFGRQGSGDSRNATNRRHTTMSCSAPSPEENGKDKRVEQILHLANADEMEAWWLQICVGNAPRYVPPVEHLVRTKPGLFDPATGETNIASSRDGQFWPEPCSHCNESPAPSGWGTPGCPKCGGVEELCLPISKHPFSALLKIELPHALDVPLKPCSEATGGTPRSSDS
mmetsp:Transcript_54580/g.86730  ORF Transcript_54580/g.86730 Transcript_54580/m.86730 type:complete len:185 (-) Transcript_54580:65-619(-)